MTILGNYFKQPVEIEIYGIQFAKDMAPTDQIESAWQILTRLDAPAWDQEVLVSPYTALLSDAGRILVSTRDIGLPLDAPEGYRLSVANQAQTSAISVGPFSVPARGAVVLRMQGGMWKEEAKTHAVLVDAPQDQRVRVRVFGGTVWQAYMVQVTVNTVEGRTLQDEFTVEIEEI